MARPPLPLGTWGKIRTEVLQEDAKGKALRSRAVANYRDYDGLTRRVEAHAKTPAQAENRLRAKLKDRVKLVNKGELTGMDRFSKAADLWLAKICELVAEGSRSPGTVQLYEQQMESHVRPAVGELRLVEVTTPLVDKVLGKIKAEVGGPTAKTCRSVISGVMSFAVRAGAVDVNPVREIEPIEAQPKRESRALTAQEWVTWLRQLRDDAKAVERDVPDLSLFMMGTGARIGEALAVLWNQVDFDAGTVEITHTIIRVKRRGLIRKKTKSRAGERLLMLPLSVVTMLKARFTVGVRMDEPVFPNTFGGFRDPSNTRRDLRKARGDGLLSWVTSHNFRKSVATILDDSGHTGRQVADQIGHSQVSTTQNVYMGRKVANPAAAQDLEQFLGQAENGQPPDQKGG